jgi:hypothetical protein
MENKNIKSIDSSQAGQIVEFLEKYNNHFNEIVDFLNKKQLKVLADDLIWLHDSLSDEQRLSMSGVSLENKRLELFESFGLDDYNSSQILEIIPEEYKGRFKLECVNMENSIDSIKTLNASIIETIEKKISIAESDLRNKGYSNPGRYDVAGSKVRIDDPDDGIIGNM